MQKRDYDGTVARIAGNMLSAYEWYDLSPLQRQALAAEAVTLARFIVTETKRQGDPLQEPTP
jgi:hypothetical protein